MLLNLYKVGTNGRIKLGDLASNGDFYTAEKDDEGVITLSPVQVNTTSSKGATGAEDE